MKAIACFLLAISLCTRSVTGQDYIPYHRAIIEAERSFLARDFIAAFAKYKAIFTDYQRPFAKDCFIALQLACWQRDTAYADYFFRVAFENGINRDMTGLSGHINTFLRRSDAYEKRIDSLYKVCRHRYINTLNFDFRFQIMALQKKHVLYHELPNQYATKKIRDSMYTKVLDENLATLIQLIKKHGFPGERTIGIQDAKFDNIDDAKYWMSMSSLVALLFYHHEWAFTLLGKELLQAVRDGELHPRDYAVIHDWAYFDLVTSKSYKSSSKNYFSYKLRGNIPPHTKNYNQCPLLDCKLYGGLATDTFFVNRCRAELAIAPLDHDERKKLFAERWNLILLFGMFKTT